MAADSATFQDDIAFPVPEPKIVRAPDGGLVGACGGSNDTAALRHWVAAGMDFDKPPKFGITEVANDKSVLWLWLKPNLSVEMGDCLMSHWPVPSQTAIGYGTAYLHGLLDGGLDFPEAVRRTIKRVQYLGGDVQIEHVESSGPSS